jgi:hypothetical protein
MEIGTIFGRNNAQIVKANAQLRRRPLPGLLRGVRGPASHGAGHAGVGGNQVASDGGCDDEEATESVVLEAVHSGRTRILPWQQLQDSTIWLQGWK